MANDKQVIFSLIGVGRVHPPKKQVLKDIYLSCVHFPRIPTCRPVKGMGWRAASPLPANLARAGPCP